MSHRSRLAGWLVAVVASGWALGADPVWRSGETTAWWFSCVASGCMFAWSAHRLRREIAEGKRS